MDFDNFLVEKKGAVVLVRINRPKFANCLNEELWGEMDLLLRELEGDQQAGCVVLTGVGKHFCAGLDLSLLSQVDPRYIRYHLPFIQNLNNRWENLGQPVIAAINGTCVGGGLELALSCDIRLAAGDAVMSIPEVNFGLSADTGGSQRLARLIGPSQTKRLILSCERINAQEAARIGMVDEVIEPEQLMVRAMELAEKIASKPPVAVWMAKKAINLASESSMYAGLLFEQVQSMHCCGTADKNEAVKAFLEKRPPKFIGG